MPMHDNKFTVLNAELRLREQGTDDPPAWAVACEAKVSVSTVYRMRRLHSATWSQIYQKMRPAKEE